MQYFRKQCALLCVLLTISSVLFGCGDSKEADPVPETVMPAQATLSMDVFETIPEETTEPTETTVATEVTEATEATEITEATEATEITEATEVTQAIEAMASTDETEVPEETLPLPDRTYINDKLTLLEEPQPTDFVDVRMYIPEIYVDLRYSTTNNFTGEQIYYFEEAYLRYSTVMKLQKICEILREEGYCLKIWDAFRPVSAQFKLWEVFPDPDYVANPERGFSAHSRGNTLDVTLVDLWGNDVPMPSDFDDFSEAANRDYSECSEEAQKNAKLLQYVMEKNGFKGYWGEWWHFTDRNQYDVEEVFDPNEISIWYPNCEEFITLRKKASGYSDPLNLIYLGNPFTVLGYTGQFAMAEYQGQRGYVLVKYIRENP